MDNFHDELIEAHQDLINNELRKVRPWVEFCTTAVFATAAITAGQLFLKDCIEDFTLSALIGLLVMWGVGLYLIISVGNMTRLAIRLTAIKLQKRIGVMPLEDENRPLLGAASVALVNSIWLTIILNLSSAFAKMVSINGVM